MSLTPADLDSFIAEDLGLRAGAHQLRSRRPLVPLSSTHVRIGDVDYVNFASNNYLGLTHHPRLIAAAEQSLRRDGLGSGAAALITGHTATHAQAKTDIARWKGTQDSVLLPSGYQANHAAVQTLVALGEKSGGVRFLIDKLAHASLLDAVRGASAEFRVFPHNHLAKVERLLADAPPNQLQVVLTESIFSMDGDAADLAGLVELKQRRPFILLLDEAHSSGVYSARGADISVVTLSKAMGSIGGAVCGSTQFCAALVNYGRAYIFSTSVPPWVAAVASEAIAVMRDEPQRAARVRSLARRVRQAVGLNGDTPIVPVILGEEAQALEASRKLGEAGLLVPAVRPPTVPKGSSRLRITLSCDHTDPEVEHLLDILAEMKRQLG
ncbi:MAG: 8-amino-7-oxononanoate synthase [Phycisphaerales bacterium]|nr:8-amino-7-oxononanoate synthase [Phycisphaerales bacterium]